MEAKRDGRRDVVMTDVEALVPKDHLLRKIEAVMDYEWLYKRLSPYYCEDNGRPGIDPVVLIKMALLEHLYGLPSLRRTHRDIEVNVAYRWFLRYNLLEKIPHFATVNYAFCRRFPAELSEEIFAHILNKALNNKIVDTSMVFIEGLPELPLPGGMRRQCKGPAPPDHPYLAGVPGPGGAAAQVGAGPGDLRSTQADH